MWPSFNTLLTTKQKPIKIHRLKLYTREWNSLGYNSSDRDDRDSRYIIPQMEMLFQDFSHLQFKTSLNFQAKIILDKCVPRSSDAKLSFILRSEADLPFSLSFIYGGVGEKGWKREDEQMEQSHHITSHDAQNNTLHMGVPKTHIHQSILEATAEACNKIFVLMLGTGVHYWDTEFKLENTTSNPGVLAQLIMQYCLIPHIHFSFSEALQTHDYFTVYSNISTSKALPSHPSYCSYPFLN